MKKVLFIISMIFVIGIVSASNDFGYNNVDGPILIPAINYSNLPTVNNSQYFDGYSVSTLYTYYRGLLETYFNGIYPTISDLANYLPLSGGTMAGDINMGTNDITNVGDITADYFIGNGSLLTGIETYVEDVWVNITGDTMTGDLSMGGNNIINVNDLTIEDSIKFTDTPNSTVFQKNGIPVFRWTGAVSE